MIAILPNCPCCDEPDLWRKDIDKGVQIRCMECGWRSPVITEPDEEASEAAIARMLKAVKETE